MRKKVGQVSNRWLRFEAPSVMASPDTVSNELIVVDSVANSMGSQGNFFIMALI